MVKPIENIPLSELVDVRHVYELATPDKYAPSKSVLKQIEGYVDRNGQLYRVDRHGNLIKRTITNDNDHSKCYRLRIDGWMFSIAIPQHKVDAAFQAKGVTPVNNQPETTHNWGYILYTSDDEALEPEFGYATEQDALEAVQKEIQTEFNNGYVGYTGIVFQTTGKTVTATTKFNYE
nr:MAG TPA: hypothetical protein [Caudoviricetes sp.]